MLVLISVPVIFYLSTREYQSWDKIKDRWFRAGIDNSLAFSTLKTERGEVVQLDGEYAGCAISLGTGGRSSSNKLVSFVKVFYPEELEKDMGIHSPELLASLFGCMETILNQEQDFTQPAYFVSQDRKINPIISEQLIVLSKGFKRSRREFEVNGSGIRVEQVGRLADPSQLFPLLDEIVSTIFLMTENRQHLLVK